MVNDLGPRAEISFCSILSSNSPSSTRLAYSASKERLLQSLIYWRTFYRLNCALSLSWAQTIRILLPSLTLFARTIRLGISMVAFYNAATRDSGDTRSIRAAATFSGPRHVYRSDRSGTPSRLAGYNHRLWQRAFRRGSTLRRIAIHFQRGMTLDILPSLRPFIDSGLVISLDYSLWPFLPYNVCMPVAFTIALVLLQALFSLS
ncbi:hypothetical protein K438DRAFT_1814705 [Mycena galopus ATCC 62051]|nr:hypothetical protein K438DRAFT_1814705 [Mycena galopus ATCC 62051]